MNEYNRSAYLDFIKKNKIKYIITSSKLDSCIKYKTLDSFDFEFVTRNFFQPKQFYSSSIYEIKYIKNECK